MTNPKNQHVFSDKFRISVLSLKQIELATGEDKAYHIDTWARLFKCNDWREVQMLAKNNPDIQEAVTTIYQLTEDEKTRQMCERREKALFVQHSLEHFPKLVEVFVKKVKELFSIKEAQERKEREDRAAARKEQSKHRRGRNDWERQCRQAGHPRVASEPRALREGYHAHGGRGQKSLRSTQGNL